MDTQIVCVCVFAQEHADCIANVLWVCKKNLKSSEKN